MLHILNIPRKIKKIFLFLSALYFKRRVIVLGRVACLGNAVFDMLPNKRKLLINQQKMRVDQWVNILKGAPLCNPQIIKKHLLRRDVFPLIKQQKDLPWLRFPPECVDYLIMDSFSELTDQMFKNKKDSWTFCSHYSDMHNSTEFADGFDAVGLLSIDKMESYYREFFEWFFDRFPKAFIIFIHFPASLDQRELFTLRANEILLIINKYAGEHKGKIHSINIAGEHVKPHDDNEFPYHFSDETIYKIYEEFKAVAV